MAEPHWVGGTSGAWSLAANWDPAVVPVNADDVVIDYGSRSIDDGLDQKAVDLATMIIGPNYSGEVGNSPTNPLLIGCGKMTVNGGGNNHYIDSQTAAIDVLRVRAIGAAGTGNLYLSGTTAVGLLVIQQGTVQCYSGTIADAEIASSNNADNAKMEILNATITELHQHSGNVTMLSTSASGAITTAHVSGSILTIDARTLTTLIQSGGTVKWNSATNITLAKMKGGILDGSGLPDARSITTLILHAGATLNRDNGLDNITIGTKHDFGGTIRPSI